MNYEWDEAKRISNKAKHGVDFANMPKFDWNFAVCLDAQLVEGEARELWIGPIDAALFAVVSVERGQNTIRIVSLRRATNPEIASWRKEFQ